jgi:hypothetical protein
MPLKQVARPLTQVGSGETCDDCAGGHLRIS